MDWATLHEPWYLQTFSLAMRMHGGQKDDSGTPYWMHLDRTAKQLLRRFPDATRIQVEAVLLHGMLEMPRMQPEQLRAHGLRDDLIRVLLHVARNDSLSYLEWIAEIAASGDIDAIRVMIAVNLDDLDPIRADYPGRLDKLRYKHGPAQVILDAGLLRAVDQLPTRDVGKAIEPDDLMES